MTEKKFKLFGIGKKIELARINFEITQINLAKKLKISRVKLWRWESGKNIPNIDDLQKIATATGKPLSYFLPTGPGLAPVDSPLQKVPVISWIHANKFFTTVDPIHSPSAVSDTYVYVTTKGDNMFALKIENDYMEPEFREGDFIAVLSGVKAKNGDFVVVRDSDSNEAAFRQLKKYGKKIILHPLNPKYPDIELNHNDRYEIIGVVTDKVKKYR